jgi:hypothetical protein
MSAAVMPESRSVTALARVEAVRLAKHPFFVVGFVANAAFLATQLETGLDYYNIAVVPAFFIGMFSMVATYRLTRSMDKTEEALGSAPSRTNDRVLALCLACLLPAVCGLASLIAILAFQGASESYAYGAWSQADRVGIFTGEVLLASIGGPLLGVAAARWWRFPGAPAVLFIVVLLVVMTSMGFYVEAPSSRWMTALRMITPFTQFTSAETHNTELHSWLGSPWPYAGWLVCLCVLAVLGALLKGAEGAARQRILRAGLVVGLVGLVFVVLATALGPDYSTLHTPSGVTRL